MAHLIAEAGHWANMERGLVLFWRLLPVTRLRASETHTAALETAHCFEDRLFSEADRKLYKRDRVCRKWDAFAAQARPFCR
jgi:hypothetical protein